MRTLQEPQARWYMLALAVCSTMVLSACSTPVEDAGEPQGDADVGDGDGDGDGNAPACETDTDCAGAMLLGPCQRAACSSGLCYAADDAGADGQPCDDGDRCTSGEMCIAGSCVGEVTVDCSSLNDGCVIGVCLPDTGACAAAVAADGLACDDEDACTEVDACRSGVCEGEALDCSAFDGDCLIGACEHGLCVAVPDVETPGCGSVCAEDEDCIAGQCRTATCVDGACMFTDLSDIPCEDGDTCTSDDTCTDGVCVPGVALTCEDDPDPDDCWVPLCVDGGCIQLPDVGAPCDDGEVCTTGSTCLSSGACGGGVLDALACACLTGADCDDGLPCTDDRCTAAGTCEHDVVEGACLIDDECLAPGAPDEDAICVCNPAYDATGWKCPACGDGVLDPTSEECDDGNAVAGDGCDGCAHEDQCVVMLSSNNTVRVVHVDRAGVMAELDQIPTGMPVVDLAPGWSPKAMAVCGRIVYVANPVSDTVNAYEVSTAGELSALGAVASLDDPADVVCDAERGLVMVSSLPTLPCPQCSPQNQVALDTNQLANGVRVDVFRAAVDGTLTPLASQAFEMVGLFKNIGLLGLARNAARDQLLMTGMTVGSAEDGAVQYRFSYDPNTGALTRLQGPIFQYGAYATGILRIDGSGENVFFPPEEQAVLTPLGPDGRLPYLNVASWTFSYTEGTVPYPVDILWLDRPDSTFVYLGEGEFPPVVGVARLVPTAGEEPLADSIVAGDPGVGWSSLVQRVLYDDVVVALGANGTLYSMVLSASSADWMSLAEASSLAVSGVAFRHEVIACPDAP